MTEPTSQGADVDIASSTTSPSAASPAGASVWEDFIDIFYAPSAVFARRRAFIIPMLVVTIAVGLLYLVNSNVISQIADAEMSRAMAKRAQPLTADQIAAAKKISAVMGKIGVWIFTPIIMFLIGLTLWVVGKFFDAKQTLGEAVMVASYSYVPRIVESVVTSVQGLLLDSSQFTGRYRVSVGLGRFFDPDTTSPMILALLGRVDVFTIWITVLLVIGLSVTGKIPRSKAAIAGVLVWFIGAVPQLLGALGQR